MAQTKGFPETPIDRTPYGSCAVVAAVVTLLFGLGAWGLLAAGGTLKRDHAWHLPGFSAPSSGSNELLRQVQDAASGTVKDATDSATQQAKDAAAKEAQKQIDAQKQQLENQAKDAAQGAAQDQLNSYLSQ